MINKSKVKYMKIKKKCYQFQVTSDTIWTGI